jgi:uncharacterized protein YkwD
MDGCAADPEKTAPGACGCGVVDDADNDTTPDCEQGGASVDAGVARPADSGTDSGTEGPGDNASACPAGFESVLPLVLSGDTVPGNLELGLASAPETPRAPCGLPQEQECFTLLNAERAAAGRAPLVWDGDLVDLARSHAADRVQQRYPGSQHGSSTNTAHLYQERAELLGLKNGKFRGVVENAVTGARSARAAVTSWMNSSGHRAVVLGDGQWNILTHAGCGGDGDQWNIEFGY